jgi:glycosyltransferase involved in cell wall biosynthesis
MRVLMISTDRLVFNPQSQVATRLAKLANKIGDLRIIVLSKPWAILNPATLINLDLITCQDPFLTGLIGLILKKCLNLPLELQLHTDVLTPAFRQFNFKNQVYYSLAKWLLPQANQVRVVSEKLKNSLEAAKLVKPERIYVLPIFTDPVTPLPPAWLSLIPPDFKVILMVGRLEAEKRFDLALRAFQLLVDKKTMLVIAGDGSEVIKIKNLAKQLGLNERVILAGRLSPSELAGSYRAAQVLLHTAAYEGYGLVLAEAAQAGLPIVSTEVGIAREVGAVIAPPVPASLATALAEQLASPHRPTTAKFLTSDDYYQTTISQWQKLL